MFTFVDGVVAVILLVSAGLAFMRGFVHEVLAIGAWVGAALAALYGFPYAQPWFRAQIGSPIGADALTGLTLFLVTLLILSLITKAVANQVRKSALGSVDSSLGVVFGLLRGGVIVCLAYMLAMWVILPDKPPTWLEQAKTRPWLERGAQLIELLRPRDFGAAASAPTTTAGAPDAIRADADMVAKAGGLTEAVGALARPVPASPKQPDKTAAPQGYGKDQRREMDRLIQITQ